MLWQGLISSSVSNNYASKSRRTWQIPRRQMTNPVLDSSETNSSNEPSSWFRFDLNWFRVDFGLILNRFWFDFGIWFDLIWIDFGFEKCGWCDEDWRWIWRLILLLVGDLGWLFVVVVVDLGVRVLAMWMVWFLLISGFKFWLWFYVWFGVFHRFRWFDWVVFMCSKVTNDNNIQQISGN